LLDALRSPTPSRADQLEHIAKSAAKRGLRARFREADLRGFGARSVVVTEVDTHRTLKRTPVSDTVSVYDQGTGQDSRKLRRRFSFRPEPVPNERGAPGWGFTIQEVRDVDGDGRDDVVGVFRMRTAAHPQNVPAVLRFNDGSLRYEVVPLLPRKPKVKPAPYNDGAGVYQLQYAYKTRLVDPRTHVSVAGYMSQVFGILPRRGRPSLFVAAFYARQRIRPYGLPLFQVSAFVIDFDYPSEAGRQCQGTESGVPIMRRLPVALTPQALVEIWRSVRLVC
jgi:hypothetical protein